MLSVSGVVGLGVDSARVLSSRRGRGSRRRVIGDIEGWACGACQARGGPMDEEWARFDVLRVSSMHFVPFSMF